MNKDVRTDDQWNFDMSAAPKNGTLLQLLIEHDEEGACGGGFENAEFTRVMGFNNGADDGEDVWKFPGWDWCNDYITEQGCGTPIAWAFMLPPPSNIATRKDAARKALGDV